jgi:hypothetical protein
MKLPDAPDSPPCNIFRHTLEMQRPSRALITVRGRVGPLEHEVRWNTEISVTDRVRDPTKSYEREA